MLYTGRGDKGDTSFFGAPGRVSKTDAAIELLGTLDELNSVLGVCRTKVPQEISVFLETLQQDLFIIQAEIAGAPKKLEEEKVFRLEKKIAEIEEQLPPIKTFFIPGDTEAGAFLDVARTVTRRTERRAVALKESGKQVSGAVLGYLNRLSSVLYALSRQVTHSSGITEKPPTYR